MTSACPVVASLLPRPGGHVIVPPHVRPAQHPERPREVLAGRELLQTLTRHPEPAGRLRSGHEIFELRDGHADTSSRSPVSSVTVNDATRASTPAARSAAVNAATAAKTGWTLKTNSDGDETVAHTLGLNVHSYTVDSDD